jgi:hypothetical protein
MRLPSAMMGPLLLVLVSACQRSSSTDRGGAATGDDLGQESGSPGAGSAAANDSFLQQVPPGEGSRPQHDETGRDTARS